MSARKAPPELLDPDGEGIYLYDDGSFPGVLMRAAVLFFGDWREWRSVCVRAVYMRERDDELWYPAPLGWRSLLSRRWRPTLFHYCWPEPLAASTEGERHG